MKIARYHYWSTWATLLLIMILLLSSACKLFAPPPPPPPPKPQNQPPVIQSVIAEKLGNPSNDYQVICDATDADGDILKYWWSADGGMIKGEGDNITWVAPDIVGNYTIKVLVTDSKGGEVTGLVTITGGAPKANNPPVITILTINGKPAKEETQQIRVWKTAAIECVAQDPDGDQLRYAWSATGGKIQGEGTEVKWIAPGVAGNYKVIVIVTDIKGDKSQSSMEFNVACCGR